MRRTGLSWIGLSVQREWQWKPAVSGERGATWSASWLCFGIEAVWF